MLVSDSNQMGINKISVVPIHPGQFSREVYHMGCTQSDNINFSANGNAPLAKATLPMSEDKRCPIQNSLQHPRGNGLGISHSWSISACTETEDQKVVEARKQKRMLSNRESARRSRLRKQLRLNELNAQVVYLKAENGKIQSKLNIASEQCAQIAKENWLLKLEAVKLIHKFQRLHNIISVQSRSAFKTVSIETGNCTAAHLSPGSGIIPNRFTSPDLLF